MAVQGAQVSVGTTETELTGAQTDATAGQSLVVANRGAADVFLGGTGVATSTGYKLAVNDIVRIDLGQGEKLSGIVAAATQSVHVLRAGV